MNPIAPSSHAANHAKTALRTGETKAKWHQLRGETEDALNALVQSPALFLAVGPGATGTDGGPLGLDR